MVADYPTIGQGADTKVLVPLEEWNAIKERLNKQELMAGLQQSFLEAGQMQQARVKGKTWEELMEQLNADE